MEPKYDRSAEDLGNIVALEHVNVTVPDQQLATLFYVTGLGLTRDPYLITGKEKHVGECRAQPSAGRQAAGGARPGIVLPDRAALLRWLTNVSKLITGTAYDLRDDEHYVEATCPWGNRIRCYEPNERFGRVALGIPYVEFEVPERRADGIARLYRQIMGTPATVEEDGQGRYVRVGVGMGQELVYREIDRDIPPYDGHHIQVYVADFSGPYRRLLERGLVSEESDQHQYRFKEIVDIETREPLYTIEHEVRSMRHPLFMRPLVNRNPEQNNMRYAYGYDSLNWSIPYEG